MAITIKEIAELASVSRGTVDRVINNRGGVNNETRDRILALVSNYGFVPNKAGKILAAKKNPLVFGVVIPSVQNEFYIDVVNGVLEAVKELSDFGVNVIIKQFDDYNSDIQIQILNELLFDKINGLIIVPIDNSEISVKLAEISKMTIPVITINSDIKNSNRLCYVGHEYKKGGETAAGLMNLFSKKTVNVGILTGSLSILGHKQRVDGFINLSKEKYPNINILAIRENKDRNNISYEETKQMLEVNDDINAVYISAGGVNGACKAIKEFGREVVVISFDDIPKTKELVLDGTISATICQQGYKQGYLPVKILFEYLTYNKPPENEFIYTDVIIKIKENI